jgi:hypothetical protein
MEKLTENCNEILANTNEMLAKREAEVCVQHMDLIFKHLMDVLAQNEPIREEMLR